MKKAKTNTPKAKINVENSQGNVDVDAPNIGVNSTEHVLINPVLVQAQMRRITPLLFRRPNSPNAAALHAQLAVSFYFLILLIIRLGQIKCRI